MSRPMPIIMAVFVAGVSNVLGLDPVFLGITVSVGLLLV